MIFGEENVTSGAHSDIVKATDVAKRMVRYYGMSEKVGPVGYDDDDMQLLSTQTKLVIEGEIKSLVVVSFTLFPFNKPWYIDILLTPAPICAL
jgi:ATP-dependent metalloprotease